MKINYINKEKKKKKQEMHFQHLETKKNIEKIYYII